MNQYQQALARETTRKETGGTSPVWENRRVESGSIDWLRRVFTDKFSWAIPNTAIIDHLVELSPVLEVGAGSGYWSALIQDNGGTATPIDISPPKNTWTHVTSKSHEAISKYPNNTLLLCWPSFRSAWTAEAIEMFEGDTLIYVGEGRNGVTGSEKMHRKIDHEFGLANNVMSIPRWENIEDKAYIFER